LRLLPETIGRASEANAPLGSRGLSVEVLTDRFVRSSRTCTWSVLIPSGPIKVFEADTYVVEFETANPVKFTLRCLDE
jgi:hypothetical protein